ncbi:hypothetical protein FEM48_Zijuj01G0310900 [Ziziphus jujuba var. spinosa]|uniref:Uncharacterized protein n=1 Tax=Ziziphus jujuba var. spinosa TaxID=714518 RepID=A0A978W663_ZIZJJ|nr:hypothetical protein FEM48_Zijuj01G0310900 [Ziziphus jujuba var. spinosa]
MSSIQPTLSSKSTSNFDELRWVIHIRRTLEEELEDDGEVPVCIFNVPKILMANDPDSYTPQQLAIGPYHCCSPELYEMERYKISAAKITQKNLHGVTFETLVEQLTKLEERIRACYHKYLDFNGETLAWMMAIDASFLLEFLQVYAIKEGKSISRLSSRMSHLVDHAGRKSAHNAILRDMVMLENQIPLFVLRKVLEFQFSSLEAADDILFSMLMGFCKELSRFKMVEDMPKLSVSECAHLLDLLYNMITPNVEEPSDQIIEVDEDQSEATTGEEKSSLDDSKYVKQFLREVWKLLSKLKAGPIRLIKKVLVSKPLKVIIKLPWTILSNLPGFRILKQPVEYFFFTQDKERIKPEDKNSSSNNAISRPPLVEEITIPSVTELSKSGVCFVPTSGCISTISFDTKTATFYLPIISLDLNTEAILRNLVAYEASNATGPLLFTRYTELMNGIIDTEEDVKLLREKGIIWNHLKSDQDVANLWNGMTKSIKLTTVPFLDKVIADVNKYHNGRWKVKFGKFMKLYVFGSWQLLTVLAAVLLLLLMSMQAFCSVYSCSRTFRINPTQKSP